MSDATNDFEVGTDADDNEISSYSTETDASVAAEPVRRPSASAPGATGRRKQAVARVRIVPGTGEWTINGRTLENYFPNKVHQQIVGEPLKVLELDGAYDVPCARPRWWPFRPGRCRLSRRRPLAQRGRRGAEPSGAEEGRLPDP